MKNYRIHLAVLVGIIAGFVFLLGLAQDIVPSVDIVSGLAFLGLFSVVIAFLLFSGDSDRQEDIH